MFKVCSVYCVVKHIKESWTPKATRQRGKGCFISQIQNCCNTLSHTRFEQSQSAPPAFVWFRIKWTEYDVCYDLPTTYDDDDDADYNCAAHDTYKHGARTYLVQSFHIMEIIIQAIYVSHVVVFSG